ncbi:YmdB family metallophosphoesterase [Haematospirillum jordaniae]|uniref:TIGR00282 family metallophosphoesterase n=1 Tax=Haematospirillum jordaniae TaxID=1549855 RepID=UPI0014332E96|nr:TIGR00282 family metallophosphoesterase [Haematospirillum jordaniae]NKD84683.1 YmdB family metallophosphoesterase [Haematospirillum jordaniae]
MRLMYLGDVVGRAGREKACQVIPDLRRSLGLDFVAVCAENAAHGFGLTASIAQDFFASGADALTLGNHAWDQREMIAYIDREPRILRPINYPVGTPGRGAMLYTTAAGRKVLVVQCMGRLFMDPLDDPFAAVNAELERFRLGGGVDAVIVDIHAEATSEKMALGHFCDGRASLVAGTHSHIPTADVQILTSGTAYITDLGMCGDYDSVIGMKKDVAVSRFVRKMPTDKLSPATGDATVCGVVVQTDDRTGLAMSVHPIRIGGRLQSAMPVFDSETP